MLLLLQTPVSLSEQNRRWSFCCIFFFLLEVQFVSRVIFIVHCLNPAPKPELLIFLWAFKCLSYLSLRYPSAWKKLMNLHSQNSFEMNSIIIIICLFSWEWKCREIKARSDCGCSILDIYHLTSVCPKYLALHSNLFHLELGSHHLWCTCKYWTKCTEAGYWTISLEGRKPSDEMCSFWTVWANLFHQRCVQTI